MRPLFFASIITGCFAAALAFANLERQSGIDLSSLYTDEMNALVMSGETVCVGDQQEVVCRHLDQTSGQETFLGSSH
jgi:hypothetical protein